MIVFNGVLLSPNPVDANSYLYIEVDVVDSQYWYVYMGKTWQELSTLTWNDIKEGGQ